MAVVLYQTGVKWTFVCVSVMNWSLKQCGEDTKRKRDFQEHRAARVIREMWVNKAIPLLPPPLWKCVSWRGVRNGGAVAPLSASRLQYVRVKGSKMRGRREGGQRRRWGCKGRRTTPGEATLQERGGAHALQTRARRSQSLRAAQPVPALTWILTDVTTLGQNHTVCVCVCTSSAV